MRPTLFNVGVTFLFWWVSFCVHPNLIAAEELQTLNDCTLIETQWSDGDSFQVRLADGKKITLRLYGVDCIEYHVTDTTDARRLRSQRRYFGISGYGGNARSSIQIAKQFGGNAKTFITKQLKKPFTVSTAFSDARGDGKYKRYYAFVTTQNGDDLGELLVREGLARAFGVNRQTPDGKSRNEQRQWLADVELQAAKRGNGVWAFTNWDALPFERRIEREQEAELEMATGSQPLNADEKLDLNSAPRDELMRLPGVGEVLANRIIERRPFKTIGDITKVEGIGTATLKRLLPNLTISK